MLASVVVQSLSHVRLCDLTNWAHQAPLSSTISQNLLRFMSIELVILSSHFILCFPLVLLPSIFPSIRVFSSALALCITWLRASTSASVLPMNIQGWFSLRLSGLISLREFIELSRVFSSTTIQNINSSALRFLYGPTHIHIWLLEKP